jgi:UDP-glucose 4-epimerase
MTTKTVLITGGSGYIGKICQFQLQNYGYRVYVLDDLSSGNSPLSIDNFSQTNLLDIGSIRTLFSEIKFDAVIHLASKIQVSESVVEPLLYYKNNIVGLINLLKVMNESNVYNLIFTSSAAVYGQCSNLPINEKSITRPINPYGHSKLMSEQIICDSFPLGFKAIIFRLFNVAGALPKYNLGECHQPETHLIPLTIQKYLEGKPVHIYGNDYPTRDGTCIRDYIHVLDVVEAFHLALDSLFNGKGSGTFNLGSSKGSSVLDVIRQTASILDKQTNIIWEEKRSGDPSTLLADTGKVQKQFNWRPKSSTLQNIIESSVLFKTSLNQ